MTETEIQIESEPANLHSYAYVSQREYLDEMLADALENGDPIAFAREYLALARRAVLHGLQSINAPDDAIAAAFHTKETAQ